MQRKTSLRLFALVLSMGALAACQSPGPEWRGSLLIREEGTPAPLMSGDVFVKGDLQLFNLTVDHGHFVSILADHKSKSSTVLMHLLHATIPQSLLETRDRTFFSCPPSSIDECLTAKKYKVVGTEAVDGHPCTIYEGETLSQGRLMKERIWHPQDLKGVLFLKAARKPAIGRIILAELKQLKVEPVSADLFKVPSDYKPFNREMLPADRRHLLPPMPGTGK